MKQGNNVFFETECFNGTTKFTNAIVRNFIDGNFPIVELTNGHSFQINKQNKWLSEEGWELKQCPIFEIDLDFVFMIENMRQHRKTLREAHGFR